MEDKVTLTFEGGPATMEAIGISVIIGCFVAGASFITQMRMMRTTFAGTHAVETETN